MLDSGQFGLRGEEMRAPSEINQGAQIVATLENTFKKYVALDTGLPLVLALWTLATYLFDCFDTFAYLAITSPTKRCGKTRLAEIIELLSDNSLRTVAASPAAIFRMIRKSELENQTVILIMDEAEVLGTRSDRAEALREILNAGYRRGQYVLRCEKNGEDGYEPQKFSVYCPKVMVLIGNLNDTLADRCIPIPMRRRRHGERVERFFPSDAERELKRVRKVMSTWATANCTQVKKWHRQDVPFLEDREAELWSPLFAVCRAAAPDRVDCLQAIAVRVSWAKQADEPADMGMLLLKDIRDVFLRCKEERLPTTNLLYDLKLVDESPWATWSRGAGLDARGLARMLKPFAIVPKNMRLPEGIFKGYERAEFEEAWAVYLSPELAATSLQPAQTQATDDLGHPLRSVPVADANTPESQ